MNRWAWIVFLTITIVAPCMAETIELTLGLNQEPIEVIDIDEVIAGFEAQNPGIIIKKAQFTWGGYYEKLPVMVASGTLPDVFYLNDFLAIPYHAQGVSLNLEPLIARDAAEVKRSDLWPAQLPLMTWNNELRGLPYDFSTLAIYWNRALFANAGLDGPGANWTWQDIIANAKRLTRYGSDNKAVQWALGNLPGGWHLVGYFKGFGANIIERDKMAANTPEGVSALQMLYDLQTQVLPTATIEGGNGLFSGQTAMWLDGSWAILRYSADPKLDYDVAFYPGGPKGKAISSTGGHWSINAKTKHVETAWKLLKHLTCTKSAEMIVSRHMRSLPGRQSAIPAWLDAAKQKGRPASAAIMGETVGKYATYIPPVTYYSEFETIMNKYASSVRNGALAPGAAAEAWAAEANAKIKEVLAR